MMSDLHWTGAALLLALAVLGNRGAGATPEPSLSWADLIQRRPVDATGRRPEDEQECV
jgi:hypothetical protein